MKYWYLNKHKQAEIESNYSEQFLGTTVGRDWEIPYDDSGSEGVERTVTS